MGWRVFKCVLLFKDTRRILQNGHRKYGNVIDVKIVLARPQTFMHIKKGAWALFIYRCNGFFFFFPLNVFEPACAEAGVSQSGTAEVVFVQITSNRVILVPKVE